MTFVGCKYKWMMYNSLVTNGVQPTCLWVTSQSTIWCYLDSIIFFFWIFWLFPQDPGITQLLKSQYYCLHTRSTLGFFKGFMIETGVVRDQQSPTCSVWWSIIMRQNHSFLINNAFSATSKLHAPNTYCWSRTTLVSIKWTHLRVNLICIKFYLPTKKTINSTLFVTGRLQRQRRHT